MSLDPPAKFFVNSGLVSEPTDIYHLLRPLLKQTVRYRYYRAAALVARGTGWVERIVVSQPATSSFFTPLSVCLNVDSFEHLEFETRPDQLLVYTLTQGDERIVLEFAAGTGPAPAEEPVQQAFAFPTTDYVQMELGGLQVGDGAAGGGGDPATGHGGGETLEAG